MTSRGSGPPRRPTPAPMPQPDRWPPSPTSPSAEQAPKGQAVLRTIRKVA
jgi:hypothetical protein